MAEDGSFRMRACGVIVRGVHGRHGGQVLLIACDEEGFGPHYNLPGGGVHYGEPVREAVQREVREETGFTVEVGRLLLAYEALHDDVYVPEKKHHSFGLLFECALPDDAEPRLPDVPDQFQVGVCWVPVDTLPEIRLLPDIGRELRAVLIGTPSAEPFARYTDTPR